MAGSAAHNRAGVADDARQALETWERLATSHATLGGGCACGMGGIALTLGDFEIDIVDYVQAEAEKLARPLLPANPTLYWRIKPEIELGHAEIISTNGMFRMPTWQVYSRFLISSRPIIEAGSESNNG